MRLDLKERHSTGPFGERLVAVDEKTGANVLVSMPRLTIPEEDEEGRQRVLVVARRYLGLIHPHICSPIDVGFLRSGRLCVVQELPADQGTKSGALPSGNGLVLTHLCEAMAYAHTRGLVHGAMTPDCLLGANGGEPRVADFGVGAALAEAGVLAGLGDGVAFAAPEIGEGQEPTPASDVYALGVLGIHLVAPLDETAHSPDDLTAKAARIPESGLAATISRAIQPEPDGRFPAADDMLRALRAVVAPRSSQDGPQAKSTVKRRGAPKSNAKRQRASQQRKPRAERRTVTGPEMSYWKATGVMAWAAARSLFGLIVCLALIAGALAGGFALGVKETPQLVRVPKLEGLPVGEARSLASLEGLEALIARQAYHAEVEEGLVIEQNPYADKWVRAGRGIELVVSLGEARVKVPKLVDLPRAEAKKQLGDAGLRLGTVSRRQATGDPDRVLSQQPEAGTDVRVDTEVAVTLAVGKSPRKSRGDSKKGPRSADIIVSVPEGPAIQRVKVEVHYPNRRYTIAHDRVHRPGERVKVHVAASGPASVQTLIDGKLIAEQELEPPS